MQPRKWGRMGASVHGLQCRAKKQLWPEQGQGRLRAQWEDPESLAAAEAAQQAAIKAEKLATLEALLWPPSSCGAPQQAASGMQTPAMRRMQTMMQRAHPAAGAAGALWQACFKGDWHWMHGSA